MTYSFRIRIIRSPSVTIDTKAETIPLPELERGITLTLKASGTDKKTLKEAEHWTLTGDGYSTEELALQGAERLRINLLVGLTHAHLSADYGDRSGKSVLTIYGEQHLSKKFGRRILNDTHGAMAYTSFPAPSFLLTSMVPLVGRNEPAVLDALTAAFSHPLTLSPARILAHELFQTSTFQTSTDVRFILLVMAIEALIEPEPKSTEAVKLIDDFEEKLISAALDADELTSLRGSLKHLRNRSIGFAGKRMVARLLPDDQFQNMPADRFFLKIYSLRSSLVHGEAPRPAFQEISNLVGDLETFVHQLIVRSDIEIASKMNNGDAVPTLAR